MKTVLILGPVFIQDLVPTKTNFMQLKGMGGTPIVNQVLSFLDLGYKVKVITLTPELNKGQKVIYEYDNLTLFISHVGKGHGIKKFCFNEIRTILSFVKTFQFDFVISNFTVEYSLATLFIKKKKCFVIHDNPFNILKLEKYHPYWLIRFIISNFIYIFGNNFIVVTEYVNSSILKILRKKTTEIDNPLSKKYFMDNKNNFSENNKIVIISVLNWSELKNVKNGLLAFSLIRKEFENTFYKLIGRGLGQGEEASNWAKKNGLDFAVNFIGLIPNENVYKELLTADILLHPSLEEASSMIISEALALKIPIIAGNKSGGVPSQLAWGKAGLLVDVSNPTAIYNAFKSVYLNEKDSKIMIEFGFNKAKQTCSPSNFVAQVLEFIA